MVVVAALAAASLAGLHGAPAMLYALVLGMVLHWVSDDARVRAGIAFCARPLLCTGIVLLGSCLTFADLASLGLPFALVIAAAVASTLAFGVLLSREFGDDGRMKPSAFYERVWASWRSCSSSPLTRDVAPYLVDRYSERKESAQELSLGVNQRAI